MDYDLFWVTNFVCCEVNVYTYQFIFTCEYPAVPAPFIKKTFFLSELPWHICCRFNDHDCDCLFLAVYSVSSFSCPSLCLYRTVLVIIVLFKFWNQVKSWQHSSPFSTLVIWGSLDYHIYFLGSISTEKKSSMRFW